MKTTSNPQRLASCLIGLFGTLLASTIAVQAAITVTTLNDSGPGSLRQAIADATPGDTIDFATNGTITLTSGELAVSNNITINGPGADNLAVSGSDASRVFAFHGATASIAGLTITHGRAVLGGGVLVDGTSALTVSNCSVKVNADVGQFGGGLANQGTLTIIASTISGNSAYSTGGGIHSVGALKMYDSTICNNSGGGIVEVYSQATLVNCTVSGNYVHSGQGAGIQLSGGTGACTITCTNCTITGNYVISAGRGGGFSTWSSGGAFLYNCLVAGNGAPGAPDCDGPVTSLDYNLIGDISGAYIAGVTTHNIYGKDPLLGPLTDNGGPTPTHALLPGSPAIDAGSSAGLTDQRGRTRPVCFASHSAADDASDIGAFELQGRSVTTLADSGPGSLRQAIADAMPGDTVDFATNGTITLTSGQLVISSNLTISGPGATNLIVNGNQTSRVFHVTGGNTVTIASLTIANGSADYGIRDGGGIVNQHASLIVSNCILSGNVAYAAGGAIYNDGYGNDGIGTATLAVIGTTFTGNAAGFDGSYGGGAIFNQGYGGSAVLTVKDSTFSGNYGYLGGSIYNWEATMTVASSTICSNSSGFTGGGLFNRDGQVDIRNSLIIGNTGSIGPDFHGTLNSLDYDCVGDTNGATITGITTHNLYGVDAKLGPLANSGGPTPTHALLPGSPAIDAGSSGGLTTDQRGRPRPVRFGSLPAPGDGSDIGAYEVQRYKVTTLADSGPGSLRQTIANAGPGETIEFATNGVITLTSGQLVISRDLNIVGQGVTNLIVSGNDASRVFKITQGNVAISDLTITGGKAAGSDGVNDNCGGGIHNFGNLTITRCIIRNNSAGIAWSGGGGGIFNEQGRLTVHDSLVSSNYCLGGGGIACSSGPLELVNTTISSNFWVGCITRGPFAYTNITVSDNGIGLDFPGTAGGTIVSSTIVSNSGPWNSQGIQVQVSTWSGPVIQNCIIWGNSPVDGSGPLNSLDYNLIGNTIGMAISGETNHNIYGQDPKLLPLTYNGGPTPTHALRWDSLAIDAGGMAGTATDQRGVGRPVVGTAAGIPAWDIGAYEFVPVAPGITQQPTTQTIAPNGNVVFTVGDTGNPPPAYQWYFGGSPIPGATGPTLSIINAGPAQVGCYSVTLTNFMGGFVSQSACLWLDTLKMYAGVNVFGPIGGNCTIQYTSDLNANPVQWTTLTNVTIQAMPQVFIDYGSAEQPKRFYRTLPQ